jgi:arabinogalactan oligomer/maltooligosaccharide transport system substrate-binding protein
MHRTLHRTHRLPRLVAALAVLALLLAGCGGSSDDNGGSTGNTQAQGSGGQLTIWADQTRVDALKPLTDSFAQENGVKVNVQTIPGDKLQAQFVTASQAGKSPDLVLGAHDWIGNLVQNGTIDPIQLTSEQQAGFQELGLKGVTFNGQIYGIPYAIENIVLFRNTDLAPNAPKTVEEMLANGKKLKADGKVTEAVVWPVGATGNMYHGYPAYTSGGAYLFGKKSNGDYDPKDLGLGKPEAAKAMEVFAKYGEKGEGLFKRSISVDNDTALFTGKKTAYMIDGPWRVADLRKAGVKYAVDPIPAFEGQKPARPFVGVQAMYVAAKGPNKALAQEFAINFFTQPEVALALYKGDPRPPALTAALDQAKAEDPDLQKFLDAGKDGDILPAIPEMQAVFDPWGKAEAAIVGGADPASTTASTAKAIESQIK